jgi:hypothetical protein
VTHLRNTIAHCDLTLSYTKRTIGKRWFPNIGYVLFVTFCKTVLLLKRVLFWVERVIVKCSRCMFVDGEGESDVSGCDYRM